MQKAAFDLFSLWLQDRVSLNFFCLLHDHDKRLDCLNNLRVRQVVGKAADNEGAGSLKVAILQVILFTGILDCNFTICLLPQL